MGGVSWPAALIVGQVRFSSMRNSEALLLLNSMMCMYMYSYRIVNNRWESAQIIVLVHIIDL